MFGFGQSQICESCGFVGSPETKAAGGGFGCLVEGILWLFFIIPGLIYTVWRTTTVKKVCPRCGGHMIPLDTPRGRQLERNLNVDKPLDEDEATIRVVSCGTAKATVIAALRKAMPNLKLEEATRVVDGALVVTVYEGAADSIKSALEAAGATVEIE